MTSEQKILSWVFYLREWETGMAWSEADWKCLHCPEGQSLRSGVRKQKGKRPWSIDSAVTEHLPIFHLLDIGPALFDQVT